MPDQQLEERFDALRDTGQRLAPPVPPDVIRHRGHVRRVRRQVGTAVAAGGLAVAAVAAGGSLLADDPLNREVVPPAATVPASPAPSLDVVPTPSPPSVTDQAPTTDGTTDGATEPTTAATDAPPDTQGYDVPANRQDFGYVTGVETRDGTTYLLFDRATLLTGEEGRAAREDAALPTEEGVDALSMFVQNDNPRIRTIPLADDVTVGGGQELVGDQSQARPVDVKELADHIAGTGQPLLVEMTYDAESLVDSVEEFYTP